jgi:hypothetical protein
MIKEMRHYKDVYGWNFIEMMVDNGCFDAYISDVREDLQDILGQTPEEQKRFSDEKVWNFYKNIIAREVRHIIAEDGRSYIKPNSKQRAIKESMNSNIRKKTILQNLESYVGHGLDAHALDRFNEEDKIILSNALENENVFAEAFDAAAKTLGIDAMPEAWEDPDFEAEFLNWTLRFGKESNSVMYWSQLDMNEDYIEQEDTKQLSAWKAAGLDDDSISDDGSEFDDPNYHGRSAKTKKGLFESTLREYDDGYMPPKFGGNPNRPRWNGPDRYKDETNEEYKERQRDRQKKFGCWKRSDGSETPVEELFETVIKEAPSRF